MSRGIKSIGSIFVALIAFGIFYFIRTLPQPLVQNAEDYYIKSITVAEQKITDKDLLEEIALEVVKYQREALPVDVWDEMHEQTELKIQGPVSEQKPVILLGEGVAVCFWTESKGVYPIIDGEILYADVLKIVENYQSK